MLGLELIKSLTPVPILTLLNGTNISFPLKTSKERIPIQHQKDILWVVPPMQILVAKQRHTVR